MSDREQRIVAQIRPDIKTEALLKKFAKNKTRKQITLKEFQGITPWNPTKPGKVKTLVPIVGGLLPSTTYVVAELPNRDVNIISGCHTREATLERPDLNPNMLLNVDFVSGLSLAEIGAWAFGNNRSSKGQWREHITMGTTPLGSSIKQIRECFLQGKTAKDEVPLDFFVNSACQLAVLRIHKPEIDKALNAKNPLMNLSSAALTDAQRLDGFGEGCFSFDHLGVLLNQTQLGYLKELLEPFNVLCRILNKRDKDKHTAYDLYVKGTNGHLKGLLAMSLRGELVLKKPTTQIGKKREITPDQWLAKAKYLVPESREWARKEARLRKKALINRDFDALGDEMGRHGGLDNENEWRKLFNLPPIE